MSSSLDFGTDRLSAAGISEVGAAGGGWLLSLESSKKMGTSTNMHNLVLPNQPHHHPSQPLIQQVPVVPLAPLSLFSLLKS